jgi:hypothetical protein
MSRDAPLIWAELTLQPDGNADGTPFLRTDIGEFDRSRNFR